MSDLEHQAEESAFYLMGLGREAVDVSSAGERPVCAIRTWSHVRYKDWPMAALTRQVYVTRQTDTRKTWGLGFNAAEHRRDRVVACLPLRRPVLQSLWGIFPKRRNSEVSSPREHRRLTCCSK